MENTKGKTEKSLSVPQYFSWVNHNNDGTTEEITLTNLDFFAWLKREFGMNIEIYAFDAGNFDSPDYKFFDPENEQFKKNFPNGFSKVAERARELGIKLGYWCGPDGFGETEEDAEKRSRQIIDLVEKYEAGLLKFDLVGGDIRPEKIPMFEKTIIECRKICPELIVLIHRLNIGDAQRFATTFLWEGLESYTDVLIRNRNCAPHHRECGLRRGLVPDMLRLTEDHGVCLSSCLDYFEDELVVQAFSRALILSPEIYGTPALLRDDEFPRLARIYNLAAKYRKQLVEGFPLKDDDVCRFGENAVSRGDARTRVMTFKNLEWKPFEAVIRLDETIGLSADGDITVVQYHPTQRLLGPFKKGDIVRVPVAQFRTCLVVASVDGVDDILLSNCDYEVVRDVAGSPVTVNIARANGNVRVLSQGFKSASLDGKKTPELLADGTEINVNVINKEPEYLGKFELCDTPDFAEALYEADCFATDGHSLEMQSLIRAGKTKYPEVEAARNAFFGQEGYWIRGCDPEYMFDGKDETFYDARSRKYGRRIKNGCLRVDLGKEILADSVRIEVFAADEGSEGCVPNVFPDLGQTSRDRVSWHDMPLVSKKEFRRAEEPFPIENVDRKIYDKGSRVELVYSAAAQFRYLRLPSPPDHIHALEFYKDGKKLDVGTPKASNMLAAFKDFDRIVSTRKLTVEVPADASPDAFITVAVDDIYGNDSLYVAAVCNGEYIGCFDRAPAHPVNWWGHWVVECSHKSSHYIRVDENMRGKKIDIYALHFDFDMEDFRVFAYLCESKGTMLGAELKLER